MISVFIISDGPIVSALVPRSIHQGSSPGLCSWVRDFTLTAPLSTQEYKWAMENCWENLTICGGVICNGLSILSSGGGGGGMGVGVGAEK